MHAAYFNCLFDLTVHQEEVSPQQCCRGHGLTVTEIINIHNEASTVKSVNTVLRLKCVLNTASVVINEFPLSKA